MVRVPHAPAKQETRSYIHLLRGANDLFKPESLQQLAPRLRGEQTLGDDSDGIASLNPIGATEAIAYDFLSRGGKHSRPFIALAVYDAMNGSLATLSGGDEVVNEYCLLYTSPSPRDATLSRMPSSA